MKALMKKVAWRLFPNMVHKVFPALSHPIRYPGGEGEASLFEYLKGFRLDGASSNELEGYLREDFKRFVYTLNLIPGLSAGARVLEIGSNPYFTSILLRKYTPYNLFHTNYFGGAAGGGRQVQRNSVTNEVFEFEYENHNIEADDIPFDGKFDAILFCEVLEHLVNDPVAALLRIKRSLKKDGYLILTTPNVNRLENVARMIAGANIYDPYSGYGPYGRHNREYNKHELALLLSHVGFEIEEMFSSDVHENRSNAYYPVKAISENIYGISNRALDLGQYLFVRAKNIREEKSGKPNWLYRSYPASEMAGEG